MKAFLLCALVTAAAFTGLTSCSDDDKPEVKAIEVSQSEGRSIASQNLMGFKLLAETEETENVALSPLSVTMALSMIANGAEAETLDELVQFMDAEDLRALNSTNAKLLTNLPRLDSKVNLTCANAVWADPDLGITTDFKKSLAKTYSAGIFEEAIGSESLLKRINGFVSDKTRGMIPSMLDKLPDNTLLAAVNAMYFKAEWQTKFDKSLTRKATFYNHGTHGTLVDMMTANSNSNGFTFLSNNKMYGVILPYGIGTFSMTLLEPVNGVSLTEVATSLASGDFPARDGMIKAVSMPRFSVDTKMRLSSLLQSLGLERVFDSRCAQLPGISSNPCSLSDVHHAVRVDLEEDGTVAAGSTVAEIAATSSGTSSRTRFTFDRPFIFYVTENSSGAVILIGKVNSL